MAGLGQTTTPGVAGPVNGISDLETDLKTLVQRAVATFGSQVSFSKSSFDALRQKITDKGQSLDQLTRAELQTFVAGTIAQVAGAVVRAKQLAALTVQTSTAREQNQAAQAALIGPARMMYDTASEVLRNLTPVTPAGTSGLGIAPLIIIAIAVVAVALGAAAIVAISYWVDSSKRLEYASQQADAICRSATPPCTATQRAQIQHELALGPYDQAAQVFTGAIGAGISNTITYIGLAAGGAAALGIGYLWWKHRRRTS